MATAFYTYAPSAAAAAIFCILFSLSAISHLFDLLRSRTWYMFPFVIGCVFEAVGYGARTYSATEKKKTVRPYMIQEILILLGPTLFAASIYMILGRIVLLTEGYKQSIVKPRMLTKIFVFGDFLSFVVQLSGAAIMASNPTSRTYVNMGSSIIIAGLFVQIAFFSFFMLVTIIFNRRMKKDPTVRSQDPTIRWRHFVRVLYFVSFLIMFRSIYRVVAYIQGDSGWLMTHEVSLYCFDAVPMFFAVLWFSWFYPSELSHLLRSERAKIRGLRKINSQNSEKYESYTERA